MRETENNETLLHSYSTVRAIGEGGSGRILEVKSEDGALFALKLLNPRGVNTLKLKRFRNEIAFCEREHHPNIELRDLLHR